MNKKLRIFIPVPCHEDWDKMTAAEKGRFCGSCQKVVMDFSSMNDSQIVAYFKKGGAPTCGRFHNDQLNRPLTVPKKRLPWVKYFFQVAIPAFLFSCRNGLENENVGSEITVHQEAVSGKPAKKSTIHNNEKEEKLKKLGKAAVSERNDPEVQIPTMGIMVTEEVIDEKKSKPPGKMKTDTIETHTTGEYMEEPIRDSIIRLR